MLVVKNPPANAGAVGDAGSVPGSGRPPGGGHGNPLQYSCLENPMDRGTWRATVHRVAELDTTEATKHVGTYYICTHIYEFFEKYFKGLKALKCHVSKVSLCIGSFPIFVTY